MNNYINGKLQKNDFSKHSVYLLSFDPFQSYHNIAYGYFEHEGVGYITFITKLR
jgi:hypothetical protein